VRRPDHVQCLTDGSAEITEMMISKWVATRRKATPQHAGDEPRNGTGRGPAAATFRHVIVLSAWLGLGTGLLELSLVYARNYVSGWSSLSSLQISRHFPWMIPLANLLFFLGWGLVVGLLGRLWEPIKGQTSLYLLSFPACLAPLLLFPGLYWIAYVALAAAIARWVGRLLWTVPGDLGRLVARSLPLLAAGICLIAGWKGSQVALGERWAIAALPEPEREGMNILLIVMDTVRADRLSLYGYSRDTTPNLKRLARRGITFDQARSTAPWTLPSHASMFTGMWPHELGVSESRPLDDTYPTVAEFLSSRGYLTAGFVANTYFCNSWFGLGRGFTHYEDFHDEDLAISLTETLRAAALGRGAVRLARLPLRGERNRKTASRINRNFLDWLSERDPSRPFFAFLNYFDAHSPYIVPGGCSQHFGRQPETQEEFRILEEWEERPKQGVSEDERILVNDAYDDCLRYLDSQIGQLIDELESRGLLERTLVIITSDHGEELGEHRLYGHGRSLYSQEVRVPLLILEPGGPSRRVGGDPVSIRDLPATILDLIGHAADSQFPGGSLARSWKTGSSRNAASPSPAFSEVALRDKVSKNPNRAPAWRGPMQSVVADGKSYIRNADGRAELYDTAVDASEQRDLAGSTDSRTMAHFHDIVTSILADSERK
jgi:arylsulfatase A-like enzyme